MKRNTTAKFGSFLNNDSFLERITTQQTDVFGRSRTQNHQNESQMQISQLQIPAKVERSINMSERVQHEVKGNAETIYRCPICDRLRTICPYKSYQTYRYCQKCPAHEEGQKNQRQRINSNITPVFPKQLNSTYAQTRGQSFNRGVKNAKLDFGTRNMLQVDKVRFVQSNNVYPLGYARTKVNNVSQYQNYSKKNNANQYDSKKAERPRSTTQHIIHPIPTQQKIIPVPPEIQEVIFYPVIHNKLVYKSAQKAPQNAEEGKNSHMKHYRYQSNYSQKKSRRQVDKVVSDFLQSTQPQEILTPFQFKQLADSIYRETNPNIVSS